MMTEAERRFEQYQEELRREKMAEEQEVKADEKKGNGADPQPLPNALSIPLSELQVYKLAAHEERASRFRLELMNQLQSKYAAMLADEFAAAVRVDPNVLRSEGALEATRKLITKEVQAKLPPGYALTGIDTNSGKARAELRAAPAPPPPPEGG